MKFGNQVDRTNKWKCSFCGLPVNFISQNLNNNDLFMTFKKANEVKVCSNLQNINAYELINYRMPQNYVTA
jgi:hypothetical protein